jgi:hypothetical protein
MLSRQEPFMHVIGTGTYKLPVITYTANRSTLSACSTHPDYERGRFCYITFEKKLIEQMVQRLWAFGHGNGQMYSGSPETHADQQKKSVSLYFSV